MKFPLSLLIFSFFIATFCHGSSTEEEEEVMLEIDSQWSSVSSSTEENDLVAVHSDNESDESEEIVFSSDSGLEKLSSRLEEEPENISGPSRWPSRDEQSENSVAQAVIPPIENKPSDKIIQI